MVVLFFLMWLLQVHFIKTHTQNINLKMHWNLLGHGFHRELITTITIPDDIRTLHSNKGCSILLLQSLPPGVYADPFQLSSLVQFGGPKVLFNNDVNIEAPEYLSKTVELYIFLQVSDYKFYQSSKNTVINISLPIHARYHKPTAMKEVTHSPITLLHPGLYSNCSQLDPNHAISAPCSFLNNAVCQWTQLHYLSSTAPLHMTVPVGQEKDKPLVIVITLLVTFIACSFLLRAMWSFNNAHPKTS
ncbi:phosphatidylinositol-glycan biosynthesis class X protein-like [Physella acuta]|uniref:phosphatidylinositol-glycan biosynthesis class X protein-like n=1 Tax=Physella acuta TaxID=109671 RepID=UPI0027DE67AA|nr:phosphatidylinositol-glycan biosynthesis class X protein-like [Physella acuta]